MKISACPICGSKKIFQGRLKEGVLTGYTSREVCRECGYRGSPIIFASEKDYSKFLESIELNKKSNSKDEIDKKIDTSNMSDKEKEVIDYLNEIKEETEEVETLSDIDDKKSTLLKNPLTSLGFALFIVGILSTPLGYYFTIVLVLSGVFLLIIGVFGPTEKALQNEDYKKRLEKFPKIAGILLILNCILNIITLFFISYMVIYEEEFIESSSNWFIFYFCYSLILCFLMIIGSFFSLKQRRWGIATLGAISGLLFLNITVIISFISLVLIAYSRFIFKK